jgi:hypothetical protein
MTENFRKGEIGLRYLREIAALLIAGVVLIGFIIMMRETYSQVENIDKFNRTKDLLIIFNGLLGIVIGYYFNRVSTEVRAEKAESAARTANETAQGAVEAHKNALHENKAAKEATSIVKNELRNLSDAAKTLLINPGSEQTRGASTTTTNVENEIKKLQDAIERADRILS